MALLTMDDDGQKGHFSLEKILDSQADIPKKKKRKHKLKDAQTASKFEDNFKVIQTYSSKTDCLLN